METPNNPFSNPAHDPQGQISTQSLVTPKTKADLLAWYLLVMGFISILTGGLFFYLHQQGRLQYDDFVINGNALGRYFLVGGILAYMTGRVLTHYLRLKRRKSKRV